MVKNIWLMSLLGCVAWPGWVVAEPHFQVRVDKKSILLGEPLAVEIKVNDVREPINNINLDRLKKDFNVYGVSSNAQSRMVKGRTISGGTMMLTLYPLRSGKLQLPALSYMGKSSAPLTVSVLESDKHASRVLFKTGMNSAHPMVRQAATLTLDIYDDGSRQWTAPRELVATGAYQRRLAETQREEMAEGVRYTVHRYAWVLMPLREGKMVVEFPLLDAFKFGTRLRYPVAPLRIDAAAAPAYLPVHVPIDRLTATVEQIPTEIALNRPVNRKFSVQGPGISVEGLSKLLPAMRSNEALHFYPLQISAVGNERATSAAQTLLVTLSFVPLKSGMLHLPEINLPYYNAEASRVESIVIPGVDVAVFNPLWHTLLMLVLGLMVLAGASVAGYRVFKQLRHRLKRRKYLLAIGRSINADGLRRALLAFDAEVGMPQCHTLQQWLVCMQQKYVVGERLAVIVQKVEGMQYGVAEASAPVTALACDAVELLTKLPAKKKDCRNKNIFVGWLIKLQF